MVQLGSIILLQKEGIVSNSSGLVNFAIALVDFILNLPNVQDSDVFWGIEITVYELCNHYSYLIKKYLGLVEMTFGLMHATSS